MQYVSDVFYLKEKHIRQVADHVSPFFISLCPLNFWNYETPSNLTHERISLSGTKLHQLSNHVPIFHPCAMHFSRVHVIPKLYPMLISTYTIEVLFHRLIFPAVIVTSTPTSSIPTPSPYTTSTACYVSIIIIIIRWSII